MTGWHDFSAKRRCWRRSITRTSRPFMARVSQRYSRARARTGRGPDVSRPYCGWPVPLDEAVPIARQIAVGLEAAHEQGVVHRDLKPANIKLRADGTVKLLDFGLAKVALPDGAGTAPRSPVRQRSRARPWSRPVSCLGTAAYMSPEQAKGREADRRSDIWALAAVLYEMLSGGGRSKATTSRRRSPRSCAPTSTGHDCRKPRLTAATAAVAMPRTRREPAPARHRRGANRRWRTWRTESTLRTLPPRRRATPAAGRRSYRRARRRGTRRRNVGRRDPVAVTARECDASDKTSRSRCHKTKRCSWTRSRATSRSRRMATRVIYKGGERFDRTQLFAYTLDQLEPRAADGPGTAEGTVASPDGRWIGVLRTGAGGRHAQEGRPPAVRHSTSGRVDGPSRGATWGDNDAIIAASGAPATGLLHICPVARTAVLTRPNREHGESDHLYPRFCLAASRCCSRSRR